MKTIKENSMNQLADHSRAGSKWIVRKPNHYKRGIKGFTLIELLVVCTILGVLVIMAIPTFKDLTTKAYNARAIGEVRGLEKDILAYATDHGDYPSGLAKIHRDNQLDPWGHHYIYTPGGGYIDRSGGKNLNDDFDLYSKGADNDTDTNLSTDPGPSMDDLVRGGNGAEVARGLDY